MSVPGSNLLKKALKIIAKQEVDWEVFTGESTNDIGMIVKTYEAPVTIKGSVQPVRKDKYEQLGLDLKKTYFDFYTSNNILGVDRDYSGDRATFQGVELKVADETEWFGIDGWNHCLLVKAPFNNA